MSFCLPEASEPGGNRWLSVRVKPDGAVSIDAVAIYMYAVWGGDTLSPFEVWTGNAFGEMKARCTLPGDGLVEPSHFGAFHLTKRKWLPCASSDWCGWIGEATRYSGTVINRDIPGLWSSNIPGFVVAPPAVQVRCALSGDASSQHEGDACPPGPEGTYEWCKLPRSPYGDAGCAWHPAQLDQAMLQQMDISDGRTKYNELILEWDGFVRHLPVSVEAIFVLPQSSDTQLQEALETHAAFVSEYNLNAGVNAPPLLRYDQEKEAPFSPLQI